MRHNQPAESEAVSFAPDKLGKPPKALEDKMAVRTYFGKDDPNAPPPKWMTALDKTSPIAMFGIAVTLSVIQVHFVLLMMVIARFTSVGT